MKRSARTLPTTMPGVKLPAQSVTHQPPVRSASFIVGRQTTPFVPVHQPHVVQPQQPTGTSHYGSWTCRRSSIALTWSSNGPDGLSAHLPPANIENRSVVMDHHLLPTSRVRPNFPAQITSDVVEQSAGFEILPVPPPVCPANGTNQDDSSMIPEWASRCFMAPMVGSAQTAPCAPRGDGQQTPPMVSVSLARPCRTALCRVRLWKDPRPRCLGLHAEGELIGPDPCVEFGLDGRPACPGFMSASRSNFHAGVPPTHPRVD